MCRRRYRPRMRCSIFQKAFIDFEDIHKDFNVSFEDYQEGVENVFHSIIAKDGNVLKKHWQIWHVSVPIISVPCLNVRQEKIIRHTLQESAWKKRWSCC